MYPAVIDLGTALTDGIVMHPAKRFALAAFEADAKVPGIFKDTGCRILNVRLGRRI